MSNTMHLDDFNSLLSFATEKNKELNKIKIENLKYFPEHKFKLYKGERLENMVKSIKQYGVILPIIVWKNNNNYIILSGHNRVEACKLAGIEYIPCIIKDNLTLEDATLIVTETNLMQRSFTDLSHSERAYTLEQHFNALKCQGKRNDLLQEIEKLTNIEKKEHNIKKIGNEYNLSKDTVARYIRLTKLIPSLLDKIDNEILPLRVGYNISFLENENIQNKINNFLNAGAKINIKKSQIMKNDYKEGKLTIHNIKDYLFDKNLKKDKIKYFKINNNITNKYFDKNFKQEEIENIIEKALEMYFNSK